MRTTWSSVKIVTPDLSAAGGLPSRTYEWDGAGMGAAGDRLGGSEDLEGLMEVSVSLSSEGLSNSFRLSFAPERIDDNYSWARRIPYYSLVTIDMASDAEPFGDETTVMVGLTGFPSERQRFGDQPQRVVTVEGRGIEVVLTDHGVWHAPYFELNPWAIESQMERNIIQGPLKERLEGRPAWPRELWNEALDPRQALLRILGYYLTKNDSTVVDLGLPSGNRVAELLLPPSMTMADFDSWVAPTYDAKGNITRKASPLKIPAEWTLADSRLELVASAFVPTAGTISQLMGSILDPLLHEFFVRYENGVARLHHRVRPYAHDAPDEGASVHAMREAANPGRGKQTVPEYDNVNDPSGLARVPVSAARSRFASSDTVSTIVITDDDVLSTQLQHGTTIRNAFYVEPAQAEFGPIRQAFRASIAPVLAGHNSQASYLGRFGPRQLEHRTPYLNLGGENEVDVIERVNTRLSIMLRDWFEPEPIMATGTISCTGQSRFKPGNRLVWTGGGGTWEFYIVGVSHSYSFATGSFLSQLKVRRGWNLGDGTYHSDRRFEESDTNDFLGGQAPRPAGPE